ncbi:MAG TPA: DUF4389 domain-containing protein [Streptosporangiaceae bacterium]|nr:DUF4389 domain-containing protein [Streptosporangiaceae bacterium]
MSQMPQGSSPIPGAQGGAAGTSDEILVAFAEPAAQDRASVLVRIILAIPHFIVLWVLGVAAEVVLVICWVAALFMGRLPGGLADYLAGYLRWSTRFYAYLYLLTDRYPPFEFADADYPARLLVRPGRLNRLAVFFRIILVIPASIISLLLIYGMGTIAMFVTWLIVLINGSMPRPLHEAIAVVTRFHIRLTGYMFLLTGSYPWGLFGDEPDVPGAVAAGYLPTVPGDPAAAGYGEPSPGQAVPGQPEFGQPGNVQPVPGQPEWGQPGNIQPVPGQPGAGQPGAGQPGYAVPGYAQSAAVTRWLGGDQPWRLVLSSTAKGLVTLFLALGLIIFAAYLVLFLVIAAVSKNNNVSRADAAISVEGSFATLSGTLSTFGTKTAACQGRLSCVTAVDKQMAHAFTAFARDVHGISMPSLAATAAAGTVASDATQAGNDFQRLSKVTSVSQYQQVVAGTGLQALLIQFDADYQNLGRTLGLG